MPSALLRVRLTPRADRNRIVREEGDVLHVRVTAPPVEGAANAALLALLSDALGVRKTALSIKAGAAAREKIVEIEGVEEAELRSRLFRILSTGNTDGRR
jgi:uncharacterized protein (TIGR00251 family)